MALTFFGAAAGGTLISVQGRMNGELSVRWQAPLDAAIWSFLSGWAVLCLLLVLLPQVRRALLRLPPALRDGRLRWWQCLGGMSGALFVAVQTYAVPLVGVAVFTVAAVGGQTANSLVVDRFGLGPGGRTGVTAARLAAAVVAVLGAGLASAAQGGSGHVLVVPALLALGVGLGLAAQLAVNGRVNEVTRLPLATTWLNFSMGLVMLGLLSGVRLASGGTFGRVSGAPWWAWFGGVCGIAAVAAASWAVKLLGVLLVALATLTGQLSSAVLLDLLTPATRSHVGWQLLSGVMVTFAAAALGAARRGADFR